ncbi:hypothetical protein ACRJ4B_10065 [Streptomyces sp. GTA36]
MRYQRRTPMLQKVVEAVGFLLAGRGGARLLGLLSAPLSRTSVLFQLMRVPLPPVVTPRVLGSGHWGQKTRSQPYAGAVTVCEDPISNRDSRFDEVRQVELNRS